MNHLCKCLKIRLGLILQGLHSLCLTLDIFEELLLLDDEVLLLGEQRLQLGDPLLRCLQLLGLGEQILSERLDLFAVGRLHHLSLLKRGGTKRETRLVRIFIFF